MSNEKQRHCSYCDGPIVTLGSMGRLTHGRCRDCGLGHNWKRAMSKKMRDMVKQFHYDEPMGGDKWSNPS